TRLGIFNTAVQSTRMATAPSLDRTLTTLLALPLARLHVSPLVAVLEPISISTGRLTAWIGRELRSTRHSTASFTPSPSSSQALCSNQESESGRIMTASRLRRTYPLLNR